MGERTWRRRSGGAVPTARHLGLDAVRLGGAALLHRGHHLHLRALFRLAHGQRPGRRAGGLGLWRRRGRRSSSPSCRRCSARSPTRPARKKPWIGFFAVIQIVALCHALVRRARLQPGPRARLLLPGDARGGILDRLQRFDDAAAGRQGRYRPRLQHRLGPRLSRRHDRADLRRDCSSPPRPRPARRCSGIDAAVRPRSGAGRGCPRHRAARGALVSRLHPADVPLHAGRRTGACRLRQAVSVGLVRTEGDADRGAAAGSASCASSSPA